MLYDVASCYDFHDGSKGHDSRTEDGFRGRTLGVMKILPQRRKSAFWFQNRRVTDVLHTSQ